MSLVLRAVVKTGVNAVALYVASFLVAGITFTHESSWTGTLVGIVLIALVLGAINAVIKPVVKFFSLPLIWLSLGLFTLVINALMLELLSWLSDIHRLNLGFHVDSFFWSAVLGAIVVSIVSMILNVVVPEPDGR